jgi:putative ABC transport system permease protein
MDVLKNFSELILELKGIFYLVFGLIIIAFLIIFTGLFFAEYKNREIEIGILRSLGGKKTDIIKLILLESLYLSTTGAIIGIIINIIIFFIAFQESFASFSFGSVSTDLLFFSGLSLATLTAIIILSCLGTLYTALYASGLDPYYIMRRGK